MNSIRITSIALLCLFLLAALPAWTQSNPRLQALTLEQQGQNASAEEIWQGILRTQPRNAEALAHVALDEARQEHYSRAVSYYRKALAINPAIPSLRLNLGLALFKASQFKEAAAVFTDELGKHPGDQRVTILVGMSEYGAGNYSSAIPYLRKAADADPQNLGLRLTLAHSCMWTRQFPCVMDVYHQILALNADSAEADMLAGEALDAMGDNEGSLKQFRAAERANPKEPDVHFGIGYILWTQKQYDEAGKEFRAEIENDPNHGHSHAYLGDVLIHQNDFAAAKTELEKAAAIDPKLPLVHLDLGIVYTEAKENENAIRELKKAAELNPKDADPHWKLARIYQQMGRKQEANAEFSLVSSLKKQQYQSLYKQIAGAHPAPPPQP